MDTKYEITCEATATIGERWRFDLPANWEEITEDEREDAISDAASAGECLDDWVIGNEQTREWDLETLQVADAGGMSTSDGLGDRGEFNSGYLPPNRSGLDDAEYEHAAEAAFDLLGCWIEDENGVWQVTCWDADGKDGWATVGNGTHWNRPEQVEVLDAKYNVEPRKISDEAAIDALLPLALGGSAADLASRVYELLRDTGRVYPA